MQAAAIQFKGAKGDKRASLVALRRLAARAAESSDLLVLPEMAATGYLFPSRRAAQAVAEAPDGPTFQALAPVAAEHRVWLVVGFPELARDRLFNSALIIDPSGALHGVYRKTLLFDADRSWATPGDSGYLKVQTARGSFGVGICMDLNDDRFTGWCASAGVDVVALPTNWLHEEIPVWPYWVMRMVGVGAVLVAGNTYGREGAITFAGQSAIIDRGRVLAGAPFAGDTVIHAQLDV